MVALIGYGLLGIVVAVGVVAVLVLILPADHLGGAPRDVVPAGLPARPDIGAADVARVRLPVTLRGYRMVDTDAVLDRLAVELERRDDEIEDLRRAAGLPLRATETGDGSTGFGATALSTTDPGSAEISTADRGSTDHRAYVGVDDAAAGPQPAGSPLDHDSADHDSADDDAANGDAADNDAADDDAADDDAAEDDAADEARSRR